MKALMLILLAALSVCEEGDLGNPRAGLDVALEAVHRMLLEPLGISSAPIRTEVDDAPKGCRPDSFTIHVGSPERRGFSEILTIRTIVVDGKLRFLSASGDSLSWKPIGCPKEVRERAIRYLVEKTGWSRLDEPLRQGAKPDLEELRFLDHRSRPELASGTRTVVFSAETGLPILIGVPINSALVGCAAE